MSALGDKTEFKLRAILLGERIDLRALENTEPLARAPLTIELEGGGVAVLFRYGTAVLFDVKPVAEATFLAMLAPMVSQPYAEHLTESIDVRVDPAAREGARNDVVWLQSASVERLQLVADVLARSTMLDLYERKVSDSFEYIEPIAENLRRHGMDRRRTRELRRYIGETLLSEHRMVGRVQVADKPELLWEHPELDPLYQRIEDEFEISERQLVLERKLDLVSRTARTMLELLQTQHSLRVEWYIVVLIVVEILLTLYQMFLSPTGH